MQSGLFCAATLPKTRIELRPFVSSWSGASCLARDSMSSSEQRVPSRPQSIIDEFLIGGVSTCAACLLSNPLEVIKTRMQLQGELKAAGTYTRHYRNVLHAGYTIVTKEGLWSLQKGLGPALMYQFTMNGLRLGTYQSLVNNGFTTNVEGQSDFGSTVLAGALAGCLGGAVASPLYLVKTQLQARSAQEIAVGHQHGYRGMRDAMQHIYRQHGVRGLWRGVNGQVPRLMLGSALQLSTFSSIKNHIRGLEVLPEGWVSPAAACVSSLNIVIFMEPFDVVRTRIYNQPIDAHGRGLYYSGFLDCFAKISRAEGIHGFYKGAWAAWFRMAPQAVLGLSFWDAFRDFYRRHV